MAAPRSPRRSASWARSKSCCAVPLISSSPGALYRAFSPGLKTTEAVTGPADATIRRWAESTPASFRFACKLPREITHERLLRDCKTELAAFLHTLEPLASKLHVILIQLPPSFAPKPGRPLLRNFLAQLPR